MLWEIDTKAAGRLNDIAKRSRVRRMLLATDPIARAERISGTGWRS